MMEYNWFKAQSWEKVTETNVKSKYSDQPAKCLSYASPLRKHANSNILKILQSKKRKIFRQIILIFFIFLFKT